MAFYSDSMLCNRYIIAAAVAPSLFSCFCHMFDHMHSQRNSIMISFHTFFYCCYSNVCGEGGGGGSLVRMAECKIDRIDGGRRRHSSM